MRTRHWLASLLSVALWSTAAVTASAQPGYDAGAEAGYDAPPLGFTPYVDPGSAQAASLSPSYGGIEAAGWPQGATAWPQISPFESPPIDQHRYQNGFWFNEQVRGSRRYYATMSGTLNKYSAPNDTTVGDDNAPLYFQLANGTNQTAATQVPVFVPHNWSEVKDPLTSGGFMGMLGWFNPDNSGAYFNGFWADEGRSQLNLVDPPGDPLRPVDTLRAYGGIPLFDGGDPTTLPPVPPNTTGVTVPGGGTQPYDMYYRLAWQSQSYGAGAGWYSGAIYQRNNFMIRPSFGARYLQIRENATFNGLDSGLSYTINTGSTTTGQGGANAGVAVLGPVPGTVVGVPDVFETFVRANTKSQLGGPEIGLRFDLGTDNFLIWTQSKLGILANHTTRELEGFGVGRARGPTSLTNPTPNDPTQTGFHSQESTTAVAPTFEQSIFLRAPLLAHVPGINKMKVFEQAQFNIGYTFLVVGQVYRPGDIIQWQGYPYFPQLSGQKSTFYVSSLSLGLEWDF